MSLLYLRSFKLEKYNWIEKKYEIRFQTKIWRKNGANYHFLPFYGNDSNHFKGFGNWKLQESLINSSYRPSNKKKQPGQKLQTNKANTKI